MLNKYHTESEMEESVNILANFDAGTSKKIADYVRGKPIIILGKGSSQIFPAANAKRRSYRLNPELRVEISLPENIEVDHIPKDAFVFLGSNSGKTYEILEMAEKLKSRKIEFFGVTADPGSDLARLCNGRIYRLQGNFEKGVAATKSIIDQALFYDSIIHEILGLEFPLGNKGKLSEQACRIMEENFNREMPDDILDRTHPHEDNTYYWIDHDTGVGAELKLKTNEIAGKRAIYESGTQILHGPGEAMKPKDVVFVVGSRFYTQKDREELQKLAAKTRAETISLEEDSYLCHLNTRLIPEFEGYCQLPSGWNLLRRIAYKLDRNIDKPTVAVKYREGILKVTL